MALISLADMAAEVVSKCKSNDRPLDTDLVERSIQRIALSVLNNFPWTFLEATDPASTVTVASQAQYILTGSNNDCRFVLDLKYDGDILVYKDKSIYYHIKNSNLVSPVKMWTIVGENDSEFPIIEINGTPQVAGITIEYPYTKKVDPGDAFAQMKADLADYVVQKATAEYYPYPQKTKMYEDAAQASLAACLKRFTRKRNDVVTDVLDDETKRRNLELNAMVSDADFGPCNIYNE